MNRLGWLTLGGVAVAASTHCSYPTFVFDGSGGSGGKGTTRSSSSSSSASSSGSGGSGGASGTGGSSSGDLTCADVHGAYGCCDTNGVLHYCLDGVTVKSEDCTAEIELCGWDPSAGYYDCSLFPSDPDPNHPIDCGQ